MNMEHINLVIICIQDSFIWYKTILYDINKVYIAPHNSGFTYHRIIYPIACKLLENTIYDNYVNINDIFL